MQDAPGGAQASSWALVLCGDRAWRALSTQVGSRLCPACWAGRSLHPPLCFSRGVKEEVMLTVVLSLCNHNYVSLVAMIAVKFQFSWFRWL